MKQHDAASWRLVDWRQVSAGFRDGRIGIVASHWAEIRGRDPVPRRSALEPARMPGSLEIVWMVERMADGRYRYRLAGEVISRTHGGIRRGSDPEQLYQPDALAMFRRRWEFVLNEPCVMRAEGTVRLSNGRVVDVERLMLPLRNEEEVTVILGATNYMQADLQRTMPTEFPPTDVRYVPVTEIPELRASA